MSRTEFQERLKARLTELQRSHHGGPFSLDLAEAAVNELVDELLGGTAPVPLGGGIVFEPATEDDVKRGVIRYRWKP